MFYLYFAYRVSFDFLWCFHFFVYRESVHFLASNNKNDEVFNILVDKGTDFNAVDDDIFFCVFMMFFLFIFKTLLHYLSYTNNSELVKNIFSNNLCDFAFDSEGNSPFHIAVKEKNYEIVSTYIELYGPGIINSKGENGCDSIEIAKQNNDDKMIALLENYQNDNITSSSNSSAKLFSAVANNDLQTVMSLIGNGESINQVNNQGFSPLGYAIYNDSFDIVKYLLNNGAKTHIGSAIKIAASRRNKRICELLIEKIPDINELDENNLTFLDYIVSDQFNSELFIYLLKKGAKLDQTNHQDQMSPFDILVEERNIEALDAMAANKIPLDLPNHYSFTHSAASLKDRSFLIHIIECGGNVNFEYNGMVPIQAALANPINQQDEVSALEDIKLLLNPTLFEDSFETALLLLEYGADPKKCFLQAIKDNDQLAVFFYLITGFEQKSIFSKTSEVINQLIRFFSSDSTDEIAQILLSNNKLLNIAARFSPPETLAFLISKGYDIDAPDSNGMRPIHHAIHACKFANVRVLVDSCASLQTPHYSIPSLLHFMASNESMNRVNCPTKQFNFSLVDNFVKYLLQNGEAINASTIFGQTPLSIAIDHKNYRFAEVLLRNGAKNNRTLTGKFFENLINYYPSEFSNPYKDEDLIICKNDKQHKNQRGLSKFLLAMAPNNSFLATTWHASSLLRIAALYFGNNNDINAVVDTSTQMTLLHIACKRHLLSFIRFLVLNGASISILDKDGKSAISQSILNGHIDIVEQLITPNIDLNEIDKKGRTAFSYACCTSNSKILTLLVSKGAKINIPDFKGRYPIYFASKHGNIEAVQFLLNKNVPRTISDNKRRTPAHAAAKNGKLNIIKILWNSNKIGNAKDIDGNTSLHYAVKENRFEVIKFIINQDPNLILVQNRAGKSSLALAASSRQKNIVKLFLENGGKFRPSESYASMKEIADANDTQSIQILINYGLEVRLRQRYSSIIDYCVEFNLTPVLRFFKSKNLIDYNDLTPLVLSYVCGRRDIFDTLFKSYSENYSPIKGKKPDEVLNGFIPNLTQLVQQDRVSLIKQIRKQSMKNIPINILQQNGISIIKGKTLNDALFDAFNAKDFNTMNKLLEFGANPNAVNEEGNTILSEAVRISNIEAINLLFSFGVNPNKKSKKTKQTPIYFIIMHNKIDLLLLFIQYGADFLSINENDDPAYHIAIANSKQDIIKILVENGINLNCKDKNGKTPLHKAVECNNPQICTLFIENGALINLTDNTYNTPLSLAQRSNYSQIIQIFNNLKTSPSSSQRNVR